MKATGIVRRIDELGRIVIPKEIRRNLNIKDGEPLEIFLDKETNGVVFVKYEIEEKKNENHRADFVRENIHDIIDISFAGGVTRIITNDGAVGTAKWDSRDKFDLNDGIYYAMLDLGYVDNN